MPLECVAAIDQGTQSTRVFLFDAECRPIATHQVNLPQIHPKAGWVEHDPLAIWSGVQECIAVACEAAEQKVGPISVRGLGITNQRETTVVWSKRTGLPLHNAVVWLCSRTRELCSRLEQHLGSKDYFRAITGLPISTYFAAVKFAWLYENVPAVQDAVDSGDAAFGTIDSWLIYNLTGGCNGGVHVTDVTNASRTLLMDLQTLDWHAPFLPLFHATPHMLPRIVSNSEVYGYVSAGPLAGVPIAGCLGDQMAALLGQRCVAGEAKNTYGTGCFMLLNTGTRAIASTHGLLTTLAFKLGPQEPALFALEGSVAVAGYGISWLQNNLGIIDSASESESLAASVPDSGGVYFVPAFSGLLAPHWQDTARGTILGLSGMSTKAHVCRAMLEAICFQTREVLDAMRKDAEGMPLVLLRVDGGATANDLLMQLQADILQAPVLRPLFQESTSLGAALAAGLAVGFWTQAQVFAEHTADTVVEFKPRADVASVASRFVHWKKAVSRSLDLADMAM